MELKCVIIDDEQYAIDALSEYIHRMPQLTFCKGYTDPLMAMAELSGSDCIDFIFTDIEMPGITGLTLARQLRSCCRFLIFTTGHPSYALDAFDLRADHYLLKPITFVKFVSVIDNLIKNIGAPVQAAALSPSKLHFIKADHKNAYHFLDGQTIVSVEADRNYVRIYTTIQKEPFEVHLGLIQVEEALGSVEFIRINKSTVIAKQYIKMIQGNQITLKDGKSYSLGKTFKSDFEDFINQHILKAKGGA
ncbi:LytR/AlgR family response regulator transcription factor [Pedobacter duraquae]|uniref:LytTR family two component transcriptional regulator n=1 Tax=Pedobacter duraquae TaxID=425511 RepID=A0A4V3C3J7_9SPHI|nr:LytTR family DNA-binding domain-containing protein [Pedobacter duraquae]TDO22348.1 LytTR family two component transcriptional regulator [Pedobacter duraquae]